MTVACVPGAMKMALGALAISAAISMAAPAAAADIFISSNSDAGDTVYGYWSENAHPENASFISMNPQLVTVNDGSSLNSPTTQMLAWCLEPFTPLDLNYNWDTNTQDGQAYQDLTSPLTNFRDPAALGAGPMDLIGRLVNWGTAIYLGNIASPPAIQLADIQGAIWQIANPDYTFYRVDGDPFTAPVFVNTVIQAYASGAGAPLVSHSFRAVVPNLRNSPLGYTSQALAFAVPEPASWALMIVGFFGLGTMLRSSRKAVLTVR